MTQQRPTLRTPALHATAPTSSTAMDPHAALAALWGALRLAVVDVETCQAADVDHIVSIAVVTCRNGRPASTFAALVNPGVPIDARTQRIHGITDEHVEGESAFADWQPRLTALLTPRDGEQVVLVAHNAPFDVSRLHREYHRLGLTLPDVPVLDTRHLPAQVGLRPAGGSLSALTAALGITNTRPHDAAADATATARAAFALLERAAHAGETDFDALLHRTMRGRAARTGDISASAATGRVARHRDVDDVPEVALPLTHVESHTYVLAHYAWQAGGRDPRLASIYATQLAAPGGDSHLERGIAVCDEALLFRNDSTDDAWRELLARRAQLAGRLSRLKVRFTHHLDADGNPIPVRRHHRAQPRRIRPGR